MIRRRQPPRKKAGQARTPRRIDGALLDVANAARWLGCSEAMLRSRVERQQVPFHRWAGRLVFVRRELEEFVALLDGVSVEEAVERERQRREAS